jgi:hypothetical protein
MGCRHRLVKASTWRSGCDRRSELVTTAHEAPDQLLCCPRRPTPLGIIGAGRLGQAMARMRCALAGPSCESLASVVSVLGEGVSAGTPREAAAADTVVIAVPAVAWIANSLGRSLATTSSSLTVRPIGRLTLHHARRACAVVAGGHLADGLDGRKDTGLHLLVVGDTHQIGAPATSLAAATRVCPRKRPRSSVGRWACPPRRRSRTWKTATS